MNLFTIIIPVISVLTLSLGSDVNNSNCGGGSDWISGSEYCYKVYEDEYVTRDQADELCQSEATDGDESSLAFIKNTADQEFLTDYVFNELNLLDAVWIGAKRINGTRFEWDDGSPVLYSNWVPGFPTTNEDRRCVRMVSELSKVANGQWNDVACGGRNLVLCQRSQTWSLIELQRKFIQLRNEIIPIGFVYSQIAGQPSPQSMWPWMGWANVTVTNLVWKRIN